MAATCFDVVAVGTQWALKVAGHDEAWFYATQDQALNIAMDAARAMWEKSGVRSVVRVQQPDGEWQRKRAFGGQTPIPGARMPGLAR